MEATSPRPRAVSPSGDEPESRGRVDPLLPYAREVRRSVIVVALSALSACGGPSTPRPATVVVGPVSPRPAYGRPARPGPPRAAARTLPPPRIVTLSQGAEARCGLDETGSLWCWNRMSFERAEDGPRGGFLRVTEGGTHGCALDARAMVSCWGNNDAGALGDGSTTYQKIPRPVVGLGPVASVAAASERTCAVTLTGDLHCWGKTAWGLVGDGTLVDDGIAKARRVAGPPILRGVSSVGVGPYHTCAALTDGRVSCWGGNLAGECGFTPVHPPTPRPTIVTHARDVVTVAAAESTTCTLDKQARVRCWGRLGDPRGAKIPNFGGAKPSPREYPLPPPERAVELAVGGPFACVRTATGNVFCWGDNERGQLGDGSTTEREMPVRAGLTEPALQIAASDDEICALLAGGRVACWGHWRRLDHEPASSVPTLVAPPEE